MEVVMKKAILLASLVIGTFSFAFAQTSGNVDATISVTIKQALSITETGTLNFGTAYPGYAVTPVDPKTSSNIPVFTVQGEPNAPVSITLPASVNLTYNSNSITFTPTVNGSASNSQSTSGSVSTGTITENLSAASGSGNVGYYYLWLGGHINNDAALPDLPSGTYTGTYTVSVSY
jgi:hypothetical protein